MASLHLKGIFEDRASDPDWYVRFEDPSNPGDPIAHVVACNERGELFSSGYLASFMNIGDNLGSPALHIHGGVNELLSMERQSGRSRIKVIDA